MSPAPAKTDYGKLFLPTAHALADLAAVQTLPHFRNLGTVPNKTANKQIDANAFDPVTEADRNAEKVMREHITAHWPDHQIIGEEFGSSGDSDMQWIVDPIDGTRSFVSGVPVWGTLIGLYDQGQAVMGLMDQPFTGERFYAAKNQGACFRRHNELSPIRVRACEALSDAVIASTSPYLFDAEFRENQWQEIERLAPILRYGGDCYNYAMVAMGQIDAVIEPDLNIYDIAALIPIIEEAGGVVTNWQGQRPEPGGNIIACGDQRLHDVLLAEFLKA